MKIDHIALYVNDLEGAKVFFETYFQATSNEGYHNKRTDFRSYFLTFSDGSRLEIMTKPDLTDSGNLLFPVIPPVLSRRNPLLLIRSHSVI